MRNTFAATALLSALFLIFLNESACGEDSQSDLSKRVGDLERRIATLERLLLARSLGSETDVTEIESRLAAAEEQLQRTERLFKKGFVTNLQLETAKSTVARVLKELQLAKAAQRDRQIVLEGEVLDATQKLMAATQRLKFSERLRAKGFVSELQVQADKLEFERAGKRLEHAKTKLKAHEQALKKPEN